MTVQATAAQRAGPGSAPAEAVLEALPVAIAVVEGDNSLSYANAAAERLLGQSADDLCASKLSRLVQPGSGLMHALETVRGRGLSLSQRNVRFTSPHPPAIRAHVQIVPLGLSLGLAPDISEPVLLLIHDADTESEIERRMAAAVSAKATGGMAALLAHEVKNPLSGIRGAAQLLAQGASEDDLRLTGLICDEVDRIGTLVGRMESLGDPRPGTVAPVNVHEVLDHVLAVAEAGFAAGLEIERRYDPSLPPVPAQSERMIQLFLNIVKNAAEAVSRAKGRIEVTTRYRHGVRIGMPGEEAPVAAPIEITIADNGPGIPDDIRARLFTPYLTTKAGGTGIGLALVQKLVHEIGGRIKCDSSSGGATFRLNLPAWSGPFPEPDIGSASAQREEA